MRKTKPFLLIAALVGLSACAQGSDLERAAIGGGVGCLLGELFEDGECIAGAAIGAAGGALADDIDL
jgi:hypothetical protein